MNISRFFVDRPIFAGVISLLIFIAGVLAMFQLPISEYPEVSPPSVVVNAAYPGANPKVIAETVARPLEEQLSGVENMLYMFSQATTDGRMTLTVTFKIGTDPVHFPPLVQRNPQLALKFFRVFLLRSCAQTFLPRRALFSTESGRRWLW